MAVFSVGINDAPYKTSRYEGSRVNKKGQKISTKAWECPYFGIWKNMIKRCYMNGGNGQINYLNVTVCDDWLYFTKFKAWMETQDWEGKHLDKDLLSKGVKIYSPETCCFLTQAANKFLIVTPKTYGGNLPVGVSWNKNRRKFVSSIIFKNKRRVIGKFDCPDKAHFKWAEQKLECARILAAEQKDVRAADGLISHYQDVLFNAIRNLYANKEYKICA